MISHRSLDRAPARTDIADVNCSAIVVLGPEGKGPGPVRAQRADGEWPLLADGLSSGPRVSRDPRRLRRNVVVMLQDEMARLLEFERGRFFVLDIIGTRMLLGALEHGPSEMVRKLAREHEISESRIQDDWRALLQGLERAGLVERLPRISAQGKLPSAFGVWVRLLLAWVSFRLFGWERTLRVWRRPEAAHSASHADCESAVLAVDALVREQAGHHPLNPQCKERALVSWCLLRRMGVPVRLVMGVSFYPFEAHAWTECGPHVVADDRERCEQFTPVAVYE